MRNEDWQPNWDALRSPEKPAVHQALLQEQGSICCYCGIRISQETSHIEHLKLLPLINNATEAEIEKLIQGYEQRDSEGNYTPFCFAIAYTLKKYYSSG